jgi:ABC-type transport system substrate-binding protein
VLYDEGGIVLGNQYENLFWFNGSATSNAVVPWLVQNYTVSSNLKTYSMTLRSGISFDDGEPLNATAVYFTLDRVLIMDGSTPTAHGTQFAADFQQMLNESLSSGLCGCAQTYNAKYVSEVLAQYFIQVTGTRSFNVNLQTPNSFLPSVFAGYNYAMILAPEFVMQHDLALWNQSSTGYTLPYANLSGNLTQQIHEYFLDEVATCNSGITPTGCGTTYLDGSSNGSEAGTGPYIMQSFNPSTDDFVFKVNSHYWGGGWQFLGGKKLVPAYQTVNVNFVPSTSSREIDLENAAKSNTAQIIDLNVANLFDVASRTSWLDQGQLVSTIPGVVVNGPFGLDGGNFIIYDTNVTNPTTGTYYSFQPFADLRLRLAFADAVNMTSVLDTVGNKVGLVPNGVIPPNTPPSGTFNPSVKTLYSYNLTAVQDLLLSAMKSPVTSFTFYNGTKAPAGIFDNSFGCTTLNSNNQCSKPVAQSVTLVYDSGDTLFQAVETQIAGAINNASLTYNMGLTVNVVPEPEGFMATNAPHEYAYVFGWSVDYPWVLWIDRVILSPYGFPVTASWNVTAMAKLYQQAVAADSSGNTAALASISQQMDTMSNQLVQYINAFWFDNYITVTTNNAQGLLYLPQCGGVYYWSTTS